MSNPQNQRRELLVDRDLQVRLPLQAVGWLYAYGIAFALIFSAPAIYEALTTPSEAAMTMSEVLRGILGYAFMPIGLLVVMTLHGMVMMHRVAGPVYRFRAVMRAVAAGEDPGRIVLRDKDELKDLAKTINVALEALRDDSSRVQRMTQDIRRAAKTLSGLQAAVPVDARRVDDAANSLDDRIHRLQMHLAGRWGGAPTDSMFQSAIDVEDLEHVGADD
jgi:methyl-accepting chemotaxis protein